MKSDTLIEITKREAPMVEKAQALLKEGKCGGQAAIQAGFPDYASYKRALSRYSPYRNNGESVAEEPEDGPGKAKTEEKDAKPSEAETNSDIKPSVMNGFEIFTLHRKKIGRRPDTIIRITMSQKYTSLNHSSMEAMGNTDYIQLMIDEKQRRMAIVPCVETDEGAVHIFKSKGKYTKAMRFYLGLANTQEICNKLGMPFPESGKPLALCGKRINGGNAVMFDYFSEETMGIRIHARKEHTRHERS